MTKPREYRKRFSWLIYLFLIAGLHNITAGWSHAREVSFVSAKKVAAESGSLAAGDFNGDGNRDLIVANENNTSVLLGNGDGTFQTAVKVGGPGSFPVVGYFNGDSIQDLAVATPNGNISVLLGNGNGTFGAALEFPVGAQVQSMEQ